MNTEEPIEYIKQRIEDGVMSRHLAVVIWSLGYLASLDDRLKGGKTENPFKETEPQEVNT